MRIRVCQGGHQGIPPVPYWPQFCEFDVSKNKELGNIGFILSTYISTIWNVFAELRAIHIKDKIDP